MGPCYWLGGPHSPSSSYWFDWVATPTSYWKNVPPLQPLVRLVEPHSHPPFQPLVGFIDPSSPTERTSGLRPGRTSPGRFPSRGRRCVLLGQSGSWRCWAGRGWHRNAPGYSLCSGAPAATGSLSSLHIPNLFVCPSGLSYTSRSWLSDTGRNDPAESPLTPRSWSDEDQISC